MRNLKKLKIILFFFLGFYTIQDKLSPKNILKNQFSNAEIQDTDIVDLMPTSQF